MSKTRNLFNYPLFENLELAVRDDEKSKGILKEAQRQLLIRARRQAVVLATTITLMILSIIFGVTIKSSSEERIENVENELSLVRDELAKCRGMAPSVYK